MTEDNKTGETNKKKKKLSSSDVWKFFTKIGVCEDGKERAKCNGCNQKYIIGGARYGTSHLKRHIEKCTKCRFDDVGQMMVDMQGKLKAKKIDQMVSRELCANLIIRHGLPFKFVEYPELRTWISYLNPEATLVSRNTIKKDILRIFDREKIKLKGELHNITSRICLTSDLWTSCTTEGYISLTAHYVDSNWKLRTKILNFCHFPPPHTGFELSKKINACLHDWEIGKLKSEYFLSPWIMLLAMMYW